MKTQYRMLFVFTALLLAVNLACGFTSSGSAPVPTNRPAPTKNVQAPTSIAPQPPELNNPPPSNGNSSDIVTFTDENNFLAFDVPGDWSYEQLKYDYAYIDRITSPDGSAIIDSLVYNDDTAFTGKDNGKFALQLLHEYYSNTGKEGDISISADEIVKDGSEKLTWKSKGGGYSGVSFFELRGNDHKTFLMFTLYYSNGADQSVLDVLDNAISTYKVP
jgi:hypothetical protein